MTRTAASIGRRFLLTVLMRPDLVEANDLNWAVADDEESRLLRLAMETALAYPSSKPAALMQHFQDKFSPALLRDIQRELHLLDDSLNVELEFAGARTQLMESHQHKALTPSHQMQTEHQNLSMKFECLEQVDFGSVN